MEMVSCWIVLEEEVVGAEEHWEDVGSGDGGDDGDSC